MFKPKDKRDRLNYGSMLKPPKGFVLERAVATSFSLDFDALTASAFALGLGGDTDTELIDNPAMCLRSLKMVAEKVVVFSEAGQIKKPSKDNPLYALLSQTVSSVTLKKDNSSLYPSFHPKVWIIEYASRTEKRYRLLVMSRNLTFDRSYDICIALDGTVGGTKAEIAQTKPLIDFLEFLRDTIKPDAPNQKAKKNIVSSLTQSLQEVSFNLGETNGAFEGFNLMPLGIPKAKSMLGTDFDRADFHELVIMSPFLSDDIIAKFSEINKHMIEAERKRTLFTRATELYKLKNCPLDKWDIFVMKDEVVNGEKNAGEDGDIGQQDIHAKIYARNYYGRGALYLGSANASYSAFNRNVEFMVGLFSQRKYSKGFLPKYFLEDLLGDPSKPDECPFRKVDIAEITDAVYDAAADEEKRKLETLIKTFCRVNATAAVTITDGRYDIEVTVDKKAITPDFARLTIAPLGEEGKAAQIAESIRFENVDLLHLSEFYTLTAKTGGETLTRVIMIPTANIPRGEVEEKIVNKAISNAEAFNEYLNAILSDDILADYLSREIENSGGLTDAAARQSGAALYEKLLYAAAYHPERFKEIAYIEERLSGDGIVTEEFKRVFKVFETAVNSADQKKGGKV